MELTHGKISNYTGQAKEKENKDEKLNFYLISVDKDLQDIWRAVNYISPMVGSSKAVLETNADIGFSYIPTMTNPPTTSPTAYTGKAAMAFVTSNSSFYIYNTSNTTWKVVVLT